MKKAPKYSNMIKKIKIIHIHTDPKFAFTIDKYSEGLFDNRLVFLGDKDQLQDRYKKKLIELPIDAKKKYDTIKQECETAHIVILYNLEGFGIKLALDLPLHIKIIWRFFGWELYSKHPELIYSEKSLKTWKPAPSKISIINRVKRRVWEIIYGNNSFEKAINRIDYFKGLMDSEYDLLLSLGYKLPPFVQVPLVMPKVNSIQFEKSKLIIFGNSRSRANNHLDVIELFNTISLPDDLNIKMFFSYGPYEDYAKEVKKEASHIKQIEIIEDFLSKEEFEGIYNKAATLIFNGYRQMAMGNIFTAIRNGVKVYLSERNSTYEWFLKHNIKVFSIEKHLKEDLLTGEYILSLDQEKHNISNYNKLINSYNIDDYNKKLLEIANSEQD